MSDLKPVATKIKEPSKKVNKSKDDDAFREEVIKMLMQESERERAKKPKKEKVINFLFYNANLIVFKFQFNNIQA